MTYMIIFILLVLLIILSIALIRYHLALKNLSQQIEDKILTGSMKRVGVSIFSKHFLQLYQQIENLFQEVEQSRLVMKREKQTLDMAISNIARFARYHASWEKWGSGFKSNQETKSNSSHYANGFER